MCSTVQEQITTCGQNAIVKIGERTNIRPQKPFKNLLLQNQKACDFETWYVAFGMWDLPSLFKWWYLVDLDLLKVKVKFAS